MRTIMRTFLTVGLLLCSVPSKARGQTIPEWSQWISVGPPTLADGIKAGPIPVDEAIRIVRQIADALEYARERGIIHRDLKPANVKVAADDTVKVLDFGLAKALEGDPSSIDISTSPTISQMATQQGVLLGTAAYMMSSPEQAKAKAVDRRADI
jgi:eukaryotic-like serine/threonine-protein kinase